MPAYLVTGGAGFIGSHLVTALVERGERVRVLDDLASGRRSNLAQLDVGEAGSGAAVEFLEGSVTDARACASAVAGVRTVFHEAAQVSVSASLEDPARSYLVNVTGTLRLLEAARAAAVERVVFAASSAAYGDSAPVLKGETQVPKGETQVPEVETQLPKVETQLPKVETQLPDPRSPYAAGKLAGEHLMRTYDRCYGLKTVSLRYFNVFGPRQADDSPYTGVIAIFARTLIEGRVPTIFGDGQQTRDFTYVDDVVRANLSAAQAELAEPGPVINVGRGASVSLNELYRAVAELLEVDREPLYAPPRAGDVRHSQASLERAERLLGYRPQVDWREGLERTLAWYRQVLAPGT